MFMGEFDLIERYFKYAAKTTPSVNVGIGDDCALLTPSAGMQLAISSDMLVEGRHFLSTVSPEALGHKALAVNLSDLAACGATPLGFTLALALPRADEAWLAQFSHGLLALADQHGCALIGGDTTSGPLNICITALGQIPSGQALLRSQAQAGDDIYVSGLPGQARLALEAFRGTISLNEADFSLVRSRMERPTPRVALGKALLGMANSAIDISDGLLGDLGHLLKASAVGAEIDLFAINLIASSADYLPARSRFGSNFLRKMVLAGGDDYELLFTASVAQRSAVQAAALTTQTRITRIGVVQSERGVRLREVSGECVQGDYESFDHFKA
jgi:thiamine-monophosphate kinase